jgi:hypothetical protein
VLRAGFCPVFNSLISNINRRQMKKILFIFLCSCCPGVATFAQYGIIESLQKDVPGQGVIRIYSSPDIVRLIGSKREVSLTGSVEHIKTAGHRIQIFSGNQPRKSKEEALERQQKINEIFPDIPTYLIYNAPYWRLRAGDCVSYEEAYFLMRQIAKELPNLKKEMHVVKDEVKVVVDEQFE